ncbi:MAG: alpha/beta hydrolase [Bradymonadales bacterium]|nr:alpha/beta hydrolase [Bradymonadales bacterium]
MVGTEAAHRFTAAVIISLCLALLSLGCATVPKAPLLGTADLQYFADELYLSVDGYEICYVDVGQGDEPLLFLHPWAGNIGFWNRVAPAFVDRYRVIALDLPGHGKSDKSDRPYDVELAARAVIALIEALDLEEVTLIGNSLGGGTALVVVRDLPTAVARLVLIDSLGGGTVTGLFAFVIRQFATPEMLVSVGDGLFQFFTERFVFDSSNPASDALIAELFALREGHDGFAWATAAVAYLKAAVEFDASAWLAEIHVPTLILWGDNDRILWRSSAERLHENIRGAEIQIIEDCGHMPQIESPAEVIELVQAFLDRTRPGADAR